MDYRAYILEGLPFWLRNTDGGQQFHQAMGDAKDSLSSRAQDAVQARFPLKAPTDALNALGRERQMPRGAGEATASYALRLQHAWDSWALAGTATGVLRALLYAGYTAALVQYRKYGFSLDASGNLVTSSVGGGTWMLGLSLTNWSRFDVLLLPPFPSSWLAASSPVITHLGAGPANTITSSTPMTADVRAIIWVTTGGDSYTTARYRLSLDNGATFGIATTYSAVISAMPYATLSWAGGHTMVVGDLFYISPAFNVPADGSTESLFVKSLANAWKPAVATVGRYVLTTAGQMYGWPPSNLIGTGLAGGAPLRYGGGAQVTWGP